MSKSMRTRIRDLIALYFINEVPVWSWDLTDRIDKLIQQEKRISYELGAKEIKKQWEVATSQESERKGEL